MDRVELTIDDVYNLIEWRDQHPAEVRSSPVPLKAVEIAIPHSGFRIKGIREDGTLRLHLSRNYEQFGNCTFTQTANGMWAATKNRTRGVSSEDLQSALTVYCSLMALMVYGRMESGPDPDKEPSVKGNGLRPTNVTKSPTSKPVKRNTYILHRANGALRVAPRGTHTSPSGIFTVRGHYRHYKSGKVIWISEYRKGEGKKKKKTYKIGGNQNG